MPTTTPFEQIAAQARRHPSTAAARGAYVTSEQVVGKKVYHGSRTPMNVGQILRPGARPNFTQSPDDSICVTSSLDLALYWGQLGGYGRVYVYEVEPVDGLIEVWRCTVNQPLQQVRLMEGRVREARVVAVAVAEVPWRRPEDDAPARRRRSLLATVLSWFGR